MVIVNVRVDAAKTAAEAREKVGRIVDALSVAHASALRRVLTAQSKAERDVAQNDADEALQAQLALASVELYLYNREQAEGGVPTIPPVTE